MQTSFDTAHTVQAHCSLSKSHLRPDHTGALSCWPSCEVHHYDHTTHRPLVNGTGVALDLPAWPSAYSSRFFYTRFS